MKQARARQHSVAGGLPSLLQRLFSLQRDIPEKQLPAPVPVLRGGSAIKWSHCQDTHDRAFNDMKQTCQVAGNGVTALSWLDRRRYRTTPERGHPTLARTKLYSVAAVKVIQICSYKKQEKNDVLNTQWTEEMLWSLKQTLLVETGYFLECYRNVSKFCQKDKTGL